MSQRVSGYERQPNDFYATPSWVTEEAAKHLGPGTGAIWECACGTGKMVSTLKDLGYDVRWSDLLEDGRGFLEHTRIPQGVCTIFTNPPYGLAVEFIEHALKLTEPVGGQVAMLLRTDFDHAKTRRHLFAEHPAFTKKLTLLKRIKWFEDSNGSPSYNHAFFYWDWGHRGLPQIVYGPME